MNILDQIISHKRKEVEENKMLRPVKSLEQSEFFNRVPLSMKKFIRLDDRSGIIAEFKRKSPSKGIINDTAEVAKTTLGYNKARASALSVLTDKLFFGGDNQDLIAARKVNDIPILRKDFTIDEYQILEAKAIGADAILLIAAVLEPKQSKELTLMAHSLGLEVLLEVHDKEELLNNLEVGADLIGVNNRNLKTFDVSIAISKVLAPFIPNSVIKVSESGISSPDTIHELKRHGYEGFLMGESFMKQSNPGEAALKFIQNVKELKG